MNGGNRKIHLFGYRNCLKSICYEVFSLLLMIKLSRKMVVTGIYICSDMELFQRAFDSVHARDKKIKMFFPFWKLQLKETHDKEILEGRRERRERERKR